MKKLDFGINREVEETGDLAERLLKDSRIQQLLKEQNDDGTAVRNDPWVFSDYLDSLDNGYDKYGNMNILNSSDRLYKKIVITDHQPRLVIGRSEWQKKEDKNNAFRRNYLISDLPEEAYDYDIDKINLMNESDNYRQVHAIVRKWLTELPDKGLYLVGGLGVGKSYLAACMTNYLAKRNHKVSFVNVPGFMSSARNSISLNDRSNFINDSVYRLKRSDFLVLDDIGAENVTNWVRDDILFSVLEYRMVNRKSTIFTSNSNLADLRERLAYSNGVRDYMKADRIIERIRTLSIEVRLDGNSRRK